MPAVLAALRLSSFGCAAVLAAGVASCGGGNAASHPPRGPDSSPKDPSPCGVAKSQAHPIVVDWPSADRRELESEVRRGVVVVRHQGCEVDLLPRCTAPARYGYRGTTLAQDRVVLKDADDLRASLPVGATKLMGNLARSGQLTIDMDLVGRYESDRPIVRADELQGDCAGATHFIYAMAVGAFDFYAGGEASGGASGPGARSGGEREALARSGDLSACAQAMADDRAPPRGCGAIVRLEVVPLGEATGNVPGHVAQPAAPSTNSVALGGPLPPIPGKWRKNDLAYGGPAAVTFAPDGTLTYSNPTTTPAHGHWGVSGANLLFEVNAFSHHICSAAGAALACHGANKNGDWTYVLTRGP
jgi:hypothetical protein